MADGFGTPPYIQPGPCVLCGAVDYPLSTDGPTICCLCDCSPPEMRVRQLAEENHALRLAAQRLRARVAELEAGLPPPTGWGHTGPCASGCTCVNSGSFPLPVQATPLCDETCPYPPGAHLHQWGGRRWAST